MLAGMQHTWENTVFTTKRTDNKLKNEEGGTGMTGERSVSYTVECLIYRTKSNKHVNTDLQIRNSIYMYSLCMP